MVKMKATTSPKPKKRKKKKKHIVGPPIQFHHREYEPHDGEIVGVTAGHIFKGEHGIITSLRRQTRNISSFFLTCLEEWLNNAKERPIRNLDEEIERLEEGQSWHCFYCGRGFLVKKNREKHMDVCHNNYFDRKGVREALDALHKERRKKENTRQHNKPTDN